MERVRYGATASRAAAAYSLLNSAVILGDFDWEDPDADFGSSGAFGIVDQCLVQNQPGDGLFSVGAGSSYTRNNIQSCKGMGIRVDTGTLLGLTAANLGYPGWSEIKGNRVNDCGGNAITLGNASPTASDIIYRYSVENNDVSRNATDAAVRLSTHQYYLVCEELFTKLNVAGGDDVGPGMFVAGAQHKHIANRFIELSGEAYEIGDLAGYATSDIHIDSFRVVSPLASLDPAIKIASTITASRGVRVWQGNSGNITNLVAVADRAKYAEISYRDSFSFANLYENDLRVGPLTETTFTPTVAFATPGTSSFSYSVQSGYAKRLGPSLAFIQFNVTFNPTLGTASGVLLVNCPGLPYNFDFDTADLCGLQKAGQTRVTYLTGQNEVICRPNSASTFRIAFAASGAAEAASAPVNFTGGNNNALIFSGLVRIVDP